MYIQSLLLHVFNSWYTHFGLLKLGQQHVITNLGSISTMSNMFYSCFIVICAYRFDHIKLHFTVEKKKEKSLKDTTILPSSCIQNSEAWTNTHFQFSCQGLSTSGSKFSNINDCTLFESSFLYAYSFDISLWIILVSVFMIIFGKDIFLGHWCICIFHLCILLQSDLCFLGAQFCDYSLHWSPRGLYCMGFVLYDAI